jgi:two-component system sensor histidine kinase YesM
MVREAMYALELCCKNTLSETAYVYDAVNQYFIANYNYASRAEYIVDNSIFDEMDIIPPGGTVWRRRTMPAIYTGNDYPVLTFFKRLNLTGVQGLIVINLPEENLFSFVSEAARESEILLLDSEHQVLFDNMGRYDGLLFESTRMTSAQGVFTLDEDGEKFIMAYGGLEHNGMVCVLKVPYSTYSESLTWLRVFVGLAATLAVILSGFIATWVGIRLSRPIGQIMKFIESQNRSGVHVDDELQYILMYLISIYDETRQLEQEKLLQYSAMKRAQSTALQAQLTPHFLHNTLQAVQWLVLGATRDENHPAVQAIVRLSQMARETMAPSGGLSSLRDEGVYVENYIALMQLRYRDSLTYEISIPEDMLDIRVPRISVQPLVENAISHNAPTAERTLRRICVTVCKEDDDAVLYVEDNGEGMSAEQMEALNTGFITESYRFEYHVGLRNLNQRMKLLFGDGYHLWLEASELGGLKVKTKFPTADLSNK